MKIILTGAHFTPAQTLIEELKKYPNLELVYIGRSHTRDSDSNPSLESQVLPSLGVRFYSVEAGRLKRELSLNMLLSILKTPIGLVQSFFYLLRERPDLVVSFGGYVGLPVVMSAWLLSIPVIIHEQALYPGLANRLSAIFADRIAISFKKDYRDFPKRKTVLTGLPTRKPEIGVEAIPAEISSFLENKSKEKSPMIVVTGGNQGSHFFNQLIKDKLEFLVDNYFVFHQTGNSFNDLNELSEKAKTLKKAGHYLVKDFVEPHVLATIFSKADVVLSRAGINTLIELTQLKVPTLIVPIETREQKLNANFFEKTGLGLTITQKELTKSSLEDKIKEVLLRKEEVSNIDLKKITVQDAVKRLTQLVLIALELND